jgi:FKBP-type peptidyl-prolyl cis-trans isomerase
MKFDKHPQAQPTQKGEVKTTAAGVKYETLKEGTGAQCESGQWVGVHYTGTLEDGTKFDSSRDRGQPYGVQLGARGVIPGWEEGIPGMKIGEVRKLTIPSKLGYGERGAGNGKIPPNATLVFEVELIAIRGVSGPASPTAAPR